MQNPLKFFMGKRADPPITPGIINREALINAVIKNDPRKAISRAGNIYLKNRIAKELTLHIEVPESVRAPEFARISEVSENSEGFGDECIGAR
jgi:hypothetical protein